METAAETGGGTELLNEIKSRIVAAQESNVDRGKLQDELASLREQVTSVVTAAQFNGLNLLSVEAVTPAGTTATNTITEQVENSFAQGQVDVLSSLDRSGAGVASSSITVNKNDLGQNAQVAGTVAASATTIATTAFTGSTGTIAAAVGSTETWTITGDVTAPLRGGNRVLAGDTYAIAATFWDKISTTGVGADIATAINYVAKAGDTSVDVARGLATRVNVALANAGYADQYEATFSVNATSGLGEFNIVNNSGTVGAAAFAAADVVVTSGGTAGGGLDLLAGIDISTENGAKAGLAAIEDLIQTSVNAGASFGTSEKRIEIQADFVSKLTDSLKNGIGALVDADLEEQSARLQALQVQQQLGVQALSIANQAPQTILSLFR